MPITIQGTASTVELPPLCAAKQGLGDATIKMLGYWKSNAYQLYIKVPKQQLAAILRCLVIDAGTAESVMKDSSNNSHT